MLGYIITFCVLLFVYFLSTLRRRKENALLIVLTLLYLSSAIVSIFHYKSVPRSYNELSLFSYFYLFISIVIAFLPLCGYHPNRYHEIGLINLSSANTISIVLIALFLPHLIISIPSVIRDYNRIMFDFAYVSEMYADTADMTVAQTGRNFNNIVTIIRTSFSEVVVFFPFYYALFKKRNNLITILLWISMLDPLVSSFRLGSRTMMSWWVLEVIVAFLFFRRYYTYDVRKRINKAVYSAIAGVVFVFAILTIGRFATGMYQNDSYVGGSLISYAGQSTLNFSDDVLQNDVYQYGDNCFPLFRRMVGLESSSNLYERQAKWSLKMKIRQGSFYTFIGDLYNDFSPILGLLLISIISFILYYSLNKKNGRILSSPRTYFIFFIACVLYNGLFYFSYKGTGGNLRIIVNLLFVVLLRVLSPTLNRSHNA